MLSDSVYKTYFAQTKLVNQTTGHATISIPFGLDTKVYSAYKDLIRLGWRETTHDDSPIEFDFLSQEAIPQSVVNAGENVFKDFAKPSVPLSSSFRFENFVPGDKAQLAFNAALAVARNPDGTQYNPLFIYGSSGLGKTHLLQAIGNYILEDDPNKRVCYLTSEDFSQQYMKCLKENRVTEMSDFYRNEVDILLIDDIQNWTGKYETQNEFFLIFNALHQAGKQIVLTSDAPAVEVKNLSDRLVSRFAWGLTVDIQPPDVETREAILQKKAEERHLEISDEVIHFHQNSTPAAIIDIIKKNTQDGRNGSKSCGRLLKAAPLLNTNWKRTRLPSTEILSWFGAPNSFVKRCMHHSFVSWSATILKITSPKWNGHLL